MISENDKGQFALFDKGNLIGFAPVKYIGDIRVIASMYAKIRAIQASAKKAGLNLELAAGLRSWDEQMRLRMKNVIDKTKATDLSYLSSAPSDQFNPRTGKPGWSNHQDGQAYDFKVNGKPKVYRWLVNNAQTFGFIRTVPTERWHWEYRPGKDRFAVVPKSDASWDGLV